MSGEIDRTIERYPERNPLPLPIVDEAKVTREVDAVRTRIPLSRTAILSAVRAAYAHLNIPVNAIIAGAMGEREDIGSLRIEWHEVKS